MHALIQQILKFSAVGILAFLFEAALLALFHEWLGIDTVVASALAYVLSTCLNYALSMRHVFTHRTDMSRTRELALFFVLSLVGLGINTAMMWALRELVVAFGVDYERSQWYLAAKVLATGVVSVWNFLSRKRWLDAEGAAHE